MLTTEDIIARGYLPKELPPVFSTKSLANQLTTLPATLQNNSYCLRYSYSKYATVRRTLSIPNPAHYVQLSHAVATHWQKLLNHCATSRISKTQPKEDTDRAIVWATSLDEIPKLRSEQRVGARYVLQADVSACYSSIYTHSIPWALETKSIAKIDRDHRRSITGGPPLPGNVIDFCSRNIQSGQTIGIPIGPDTSVPIAEAILTSVDNILTNKLPFAERAFRFVDDYEIVCETLSEAEHAGNALQEALGEYELQLNPRKTRILELPTSLDTPWVYELAAFPLGSPKKEVLESQLIRYFSRSFEIAKNNPGEPVLKYAVRRVSEVDCSLVARLVQNLLFQSAAFDPGTLHIALYIAYEHRRKGLSIDLNALMHTLTVIICRHSILQHGGDIAWALWGAIVFGLKLHEDAIRALETLTDPIAILMALLAESMGHLDRCLIRTHWNVLANNEELFERNWIIGYEAVGQGWLPGVADPVASDPFFGACRIQGVSFIDLTAPLIIPEPSKVGDYD